MIKRITLIASLLTIFNMSSIYSQSRLEIRNIYYDAESWILFEDYKEALPLYQQLLKIDPTNSNYKYRIGQCLINTTGEKQKAVSYLEDAVKNINPDYREGKYGETKAPYDALYYLANAYRINNQIDKALETYNTFKLNLNPEVYDSNIVNLQIKSCLNAKELINIPMFIRERNLSGNINESSSEFNPVVSDNEDILVFSRSEAFYDAILYSTKINGDWTGPSNMNELLKVDKDIFPTSISKDGKTLYLYSTADYDGIIYTSRFENGTWSPLLKLNENINTKFWESHATISHDDKKLYFTSNRKGSAGGLDIYVSKRDSTGDWGPAENLGPVINTPYNEESPFLSQDDKTLFFSSRGHFNMGGYDIFYSTILPGGKMSVPLNVGYPLNSTDDDVFFKPLKDGYVGYFSKESKGGFGKKDIYRIEIFSDDHPRKFIVRGMVKVADLISFDDSVRIKAMNIKDPNQIVVVYSNPKTGEYEFQLPHGNFQVMYEGDGTEKISRTLELPLTNPSDSFVLPGTLLPKTDFIAELDVESNKTISVSKADSILFPVRAEPKSILTIERWIGDSLLSSEDFIMTDSVFNYKMVPKNGNNKVVFKLKDRFNNLTSTDIYITREKNITEQSLIRPEYNSIIAEKQAAALASMLINRSSDQLKSLIDKANISKQKFGSLNDLISYLKEEASQKGVDPEEVDKLALKVALMDNVLTQAAVDYLAKHTDEELKNLLTGLDIEKANLKTWTDLQEYVRENTNGRITPETLNKIANEALTSTDPSLSAMKEKILAYAEYAEAGNIIRESVAVTETKNIKTREKWLESFADESIRQGLTANQLAELLAVISSSPYISAAEFLNDLAMHAEEPLRTALNSIDLKKENIKTPSDLIRYLLKGNAHALFPEEAVIKAIADLTIKKDILKEVIAAQARPESNNILWILLILLGTAGIIRYFVAGRKKRSEKKF